MDPCFHTSMLNCKSQTWYLSPLFIQRTCWKNFIVRLQFFTLSLLNKADNFKTSHYTEIRSTSHVKPQHILRENGILIASYRLKILLVFRVKLIMDVVRNKRLYIYIHAGIHPFIISLRVQSRLSNKYLLENSSTVFDLTR